MPDRQRLKRQGQPSDQIQCEAILENHHSPLGGSGAYAIYIGRVEFGQKSVRKDKNISSKEEPCYELFPSDMTFFSFFFLKKMTVNVLFQWGDCNFIPIDLYRSSSPVGKKTNTWCACPESCFALWF